MYCSDPEPYKTCQKVELSSPLQVHLWMWCDIVIVIMGESISGFLIRWTCLAQIKATSRLRSQHMWPVEIDFDAPCRWACAHVTGTESVHSTIFTHELRWCASELIRLKTMVVAENVARFQRDRKTLKGWNLRKQWKMVPGSSKQIAVYQAWHPPAFTQCTKTLCQYISTDYQHA